MMDSSNHSPADELEVVHQNGVHEEPSNSGENGVASTDSLNESAETVAPNGDFENSNQLDSIATDDSSLVENKGSNYNVDGNNVTVSKKEEARTTDQAGQLRARKDPVNNKNAKAPSSQGVPESSVVKRSKDGRVKEAPSAISNGTSARRIQPVKSKSFNDQRQNQLSKHPPSKSEAASSEVPTEKTKSKSLKKGTLDKVQEDAESSATNSEDAKPHRVGTLPTYGFSFRCDERAARRKEFYTKLEEKINAKELEKSNMQAKTMESLEAEIKTLRKSLTFKATPMPSFYQEPPPKIELKKMPTTRPKSPKLGRKKSSTNSESDGNTSSSSRQGRFSLDEKVSQSKPTKGNNPVSPVHQTKPQRKSLPSQFASRNVGSSNSTTAPTSSKVKKNNETHISSATKKEEKTKMAAVNEENNSTLSSEKTEALNGASLDKLDEAETHVNEDITAEENPQLSLVQEPIPAELQA